MATKAEQFRSLVQRSGASRSRAVAAPALLGAHPFAPTRKEQQKSGVGLKAKQLLSLLSPRNRRSRQGV
jgi:hypothetical protein